MSSKTSSFLVRTRLSAAWLLVVCLVVVRTTGAGAADASGRKHFLAQDFLDCKPELGFHPVWNQLFEETLRYVQVGLPRGDKRVFELATHVLASFDDVSMGRVHEHPGVLTWESMKALVYKQRGLKEGEKMQELFPSELRLLNDGKMAEQEYIRPQFPSTTLE